MEVIGVEIAATVRSGGALPAATTSAILHKNDPRPIRLPSRVKLP
jgi:hypothetical protein